MNTARKQLSAAEAQSFSTFSVANATTVAAALAQRGCTCQPYADVFTLRRWNAQGRRIRKDEHGIKLPVVEERSVEDEETKEITIRKRLFTSTVFCRCQTVAVP